MRLAEVADEIGRCQLRWQIVMLRGVADANARLEPGDRRVAAEHRQLSAVTHAEAEHACEKGGLSGAIRAKQARDAGADLRVEP